MRSIGAGRGCEEDCSLLKRSGMQASMSKVTEACCCLLLHELLMSDQLTDLDTLLRVLGVLAK
eukprot:1157723-Pelagomonas_calceolata.AAC.1